ncbi:MAG: zinc-ribbon domain-containing protein [Planctomycetes bacterium]|nr:zinc-ribbon domain-containing protein [Planctomycetota bacterium]
MPIRFRCEYCNTRLSVSSRKAGARAKCPKCGQKITVPGTVVEASDAEPPVDPTSPPPEMAASPPSESDVTLPKSPSLETNAGEDVDDPFAQFLVYDDETELVYEEDEETPIVSAANLPFDPNKVTVRRSLLYMQGILLGVVALFGFALGILVGAAGNGVATVDEPEPSVIRGQIALRTQDDETLADPGAVAMVFPQGSRPEAKLEILGLRPQDPELPDDHPALIAIRSMGGDYARADDQGNFRLQVPHRGQYFLLVISANRRNSNPEPPRTTLAQIGRFFQLAPDMFGGYDYRWQEEAVRGDRQLNFVF